MNTNNVNALSFAAMFRRNAETINAAYRGLTDEERVLYVVECGGLLINFEGTPGKLGGMVATFETATRFTQLEAAKHAANQVRNGEGTRGNVITLGSAMLADMDKALDSAATLEALAE